MTLLRPIGFAGQAGDRELKTDDRRQTEVRCDIAKAFEFGIVKLN